MLTGTIREVRLDDAAAICAIYNYYVRETIITFEEDELSVEVMAERIKRIHTQYPYLVYEEDGAVLGYAYGNFWRTRSAYRYTTETTVYLDKEAAGKGIGRVLYGQLIDRLREAGFHVAIGVIGLPNPASERLHEQMGFRNAGVFKEVGKKFGKWADVASWELRL